MNTNLKCQIGWVDKDGKVTSGPDEAIGYVYREAYVYQCSNMLNGVIQFPETEQFAICAEHVKRLGEPGMEDWSFIPMGEKG